MTDSAWIPIAIALVLSITFVSFIVWGIVKIVQQRRAIRQFANRPQGYLVFAKIIEGILPMERGAKYAKPLDKALREKGYGLVTGGGTQMDDSESDVEWVGIDLELSNLDDALVFTRDLLAKLGAPRGSVLEYRIGEERKTVEIE